MAVNLTIFSLFSLLFSVQGLANSEDDRSLEWQILTKRNFSSQIRLHPRILLIVTVPWSGESRSVMKEIAHRVAYNQEKHDSIKLMVVYRNTEKMLSDLLGASGGITFICYHHSVGYNYKGRLRAQNILSSAYYLMSLQPEELPLQPLNTYENLKMFLQSTDKALLLLEFCGWAPRLMGKMKDDGRQSALHAQDASANEGENFNGEADKAFPFGRKRNKKELRNEKLTCEVENGLSGFPWLGGFTWPNESITSLDPESKSAGIEMSCTFEEFQRFESFFSNFTSDARKYFLPPERQKFGLISNRSLLSFLGVGSPETWSVMLHITGCPNCSKVLKEGDDFQKTLLMHDSLVVELEGEGHDLEPPLPADRPSIILFVDRSSDLSKVRRKSKSALKIFRRLALQNELLYKTMRGENSIVVVGSLPKTSPEMRTRHMLDGSGHMVREFSPEHGMVKFKDKMTVMVVNEDGTVATDSIAGGSQGNTIHDILAFLLQQKNPAVQVKEAKVSVLAKEAGFQLLSDDFEVKIVDTLQAQKEDDESEKSLGSMPISLESQISELRMEPGSKISIDLNTDNLLKTITLTGGEHTEPKLIDAEKTLQNNQESLSYTVENMELTQEVKKAELGTVEHTRSYEEDNSCIEKNERPFSSCTEQHLPLDQDSSGSSFLKEDIHKPGQHEEIGLNDTSSDGYSQDSSKDCLAKVVVGNVVAEESNVVEGDKLEEHEQKHPAFKGSFFFSDGGIRLLTSLTANSNIPSVVILDPVLQQHYVFPEETMFTYSSLFYFIDSFLNGSLPPYHRSELVLLSQRETPLPPFVNVDFREADSIPRVTLNTLSEMVLGFNTCDHTYTLSCSDPQDVGSAWRKDVLVLFSNSWCGFCLRMELVVREVYRAFKGYMKMQDESHNRESVLLQDSLQDVKSNELPLIFFMDCTLNDCSPVLKSMAQREVYPVLMLFPAEKKNAILYQGDISVTSVIEFIAEHGSNSRHLIENNSILWSRLKKGGKSTNPLHGDSATSADQQTLVAKDGQYEVLLKSTPGQADKLQLVRSHTSDDFHTKDQNLETGSLLVATDKLSNVPPFDRSQILIVKADHDEGFQGLIINKRINWDILPELDEQLNTLKQAPLSYGGPVIAPGMPFLSFSKRPTAEGYTEILPAFYFGNQLATSRVILAIQSGNQSATDYWFFLGYAGWGWDQLFHELAEGSWLISADLLEQLRWPES